MMKKIIALLLVAVMCLSFVACNETSDNGNPTDSPNKDQQSEVHEHSFGEWKIVKNATCTDNGTKERTCSCGEIQTDIIVTSGHISVVDSAVAPTCTEKGKTEGSHCNSCGKTLTAQSEIAKISHTWKEATCTSPKTCTVCNTKEGQELGCTRGNNGSCIRCGKSMLTISEVLSAPLDSMSEISSFVPYTYSKQCYNLGNFRLIFNSADGVYLSWGATNTTNKEIKYITYTLQYYNRVGDPAYDDITNKTSVTQRITGPIGAGKSFYIRTLVGYGSDIYYGVITDVKIEYMDGTVVSGNYGYTTWHNIRSTASPEECVVFS